MDIHLDARAVASVSQASSSCCGAPLDLPEWHCRQCGQSCELVLEEDDS